MRVRNRDKVALAMGAAAGGAAFLAATAGCGAREEVSQVAGETEEKQEVSLVQPETSATWARKRWAGAWRR